VIFLPGEAKRPCCGLLDEEVYCTNRFSLSRSCHPLTFQLKLEGLSGKFKTVTGALPNDYMETIVSDRKRFSQPPIENIFNIILANKFNPKSYKIKV